MKKKLLILFLVFLIFCTFFVTAYETTVYEKGYACLETKVAGKCSSLTIEERIFSLLATGRCKTEVMADSQNNQCWPKTGCKIKTTAQAILALNAIGTSTTDAEDWLLSKKQSTTDVDWVLQIETAKSSYCDIFYRNTKNTIFIDDERVITGDPGSCLDEHDEYWLRINSNCYNEEFEISCVESFFTNLLYEEQGSDVLFVLKDINSASANKITTEKINSFCFGELTTTCNYEGTLWATRALKIKGYDYFPYLPYLINMADEYSEFIPESFLYFLTGSFRDELLSKQVESGWWYESGDRLYDTAVALYSLQQEQPWGKLIAKEWLEGMQRDDGCWGENNIKNTAFILLSVWPKNVIEVVDPIVVPKPDCENEGYFCITSNSCEESDGEALDAYEGCSEGNICCSENILPSCSLQGGEICGSGEICSEDTVEVVDTQECCVEGECVEIEEDCKAVGELCAQDSTCCSDICTFFTCRALEKECYEHADCEEGYFCNQEFECEEEEECYGDADCDEGYFCNQEDECEEEKECYGDTDCDEGYFCNQEDVCEEEKECYGDTDCDEGYFCNQEDECEEEEECYEDVDCEEGYFCNQEFECEEEDCKAVGELCAQDSTCCSDICTFFTCRAPEEECYEDVDCEEGYFCNQEFECEEEEKLDCEDEGYFCITSNSCEESDGELLDTYGGCFEENVCCSEENPSCLDQEGESCKPWEICSGEIVEAVDTNFCCIEGECIEEEECYGDADCEEGYFCNQEFECEEEEEEEEEEEPECEIYGGQCKSFCSNDETEEAYDCPSFDECCFNKSKPKYTLIIILGILIALTVVGIIFRKKLRKYWLKIKSKFKGKSSLGGHTRPKGFPGFLASIKRRFKPRRISPPGQRPVRGQRLVRGRRPVRRYTPAQKPKGELDEVLKKLREMGK